MPTWLIIAMCIIGFLAVGYQVMILTKYVWSGKFIWNDVDKNVLAANIIGQIIWPPILLWLILFGPGIIQRRITKDE